MRSRKSKGEKQQNVLVRIITSPIRALGKAKDLYVRSITICGNNMKYSNPMDVAGRFEALPRSFSVATSKSEEKEDFAELMRAASARTSVAETRDSSLVPKQQQQQVVLPKSCSVGMGRIDEDKPSEFAEVNDVYPRSRSYALTNTTTVAVF